MKVSKTKITDIKAITDAVIEANEFFDDQVGGQVWWRGQAKSEWTLLPSVFRAINHGNRYEDNITRLFQQRAPSRHNNIPLPKDYFSWLFLMQHYRLPTRLLDWTLSPLYATFFASEKLSNHDGGLYALSPYALNLSQHDRKGILIPDNESEFHLRFIRKAFGYITDDIDSVVAIAASEIDIRMMVQLSTFTIHGGGKALNDLPKSDNFLIKFPIPSESKDKVILQLKYLGVRESNLFPDLEHLAGEIKSLVFSDSDETRSAKEDWLADDPPISDLSTT